MMIARGVLTVLVGAAIACGAVAQTAQQKVVRIVNPFAAGGNTDLVTRALIERLTPILKQQFIIENRPGAMTNIASEYVIKSPPDGATLLMGGASNAINMSLFASPPYDTLRDFEPLILCFKGANVLAVHPSLPVRHLKELIALAKANPGKYSYASPGYGTMPHIAMTWLFQLLNGADITHVPFQGAAPAVQSVLGGQTPVFHMVLPVVAPHFKSGALRPLALTDTKRSPMLPDVPTIGEAGYPGHELGFWMGVYATVGTPQPVLDALHTAVARIMAQPDVKDRFTAIGFTPASSTSDQLAAHMKAETEKWSKVVRDANIKIE
jgi:tripartite-type tricarboxylate transporter receptor subunit TctC